MRQYKKYIMVQVDWQCNNCNKVNVEYTGWHNTEAKNLDHYEHKCPKCKKIIMTMHIFPYLEYINMLPDDVVKKLKLKNLHQ